MNLYRVLDGQHVIFWKRIQATFKAPLVCCHNLIGHRLPTLPANRYHGLSGIQPFRVACDGHNHYSRQMTIGCVVAHYDRWTSLAYLAAY
jgi:hypothetical protein